MKNNAIQDQAHIWRSGNIWAMNSAVENSCWHQPLSKLSFQYNNPESSHLLFAGQRKHTLIAFQDDLNCQVDLWNSQSPLSSVTWNLWCCFVIGSPARCCSFSVKARPPGLWLGLRPTNKELSDQTSHRSTVFNVLLRYSNDVSQTQTRNLEHRMLRGLKIGMLMNMQVIFSFLTFVMSCAASPYTPKGILFLAPASAPGIPRAMASSQ